MKILILSFLLMAFSMNGNAMGVPSTSIYEAVQDSRDQSEIVFQKNTNLVFAEKTDTKQTAEKPIKNTLSILIGKAINNILSIFILIFWR